MKVDKIPDDAVLIEGTADDYVDPRGYIYGYDHRAGHKCLPYRKELHSVYGYYYAPVNYLTGRKTKRVHRIVAEAFIPNPNNYPIVMHLDNNKKNNNINNLAWGTISQNTLSAVRDGLMVNDKGENDSQSMPCCMYDAATNKLLGKFGSCSEAERQTGINIAVIRWQMKKESPIRKAVYFTPVDEGPRDHIIVVQYDMITDKPIAQFANICIASRETGVSDSAIGTQVNAGRKQEWSKSGTYFKRMYLKGEEVIEIEKKVE